MILKVSDWKELAVGEPSPNTLDERESRARGFGGNDSRWRGNAAGDKELVGAVESVEFVDVVCRCCDIVVLEDADWWIEGG